MKCGETMLNETPQRPILPHPSPHLGTESMFLFVEMWPVEGIFPVCSTVCKCLFWLCLVQIKTLPKHWIRIMLFKLS